ncbi:MAG: TetR family transcriptional regulator [Lactobacillales bacterium]|jgi:AcrR family transcriptional regulator|nr:TetR family transcriptional regulator [Lactobacillales bacterium]
MGRKIFTKKLILETAFDLLKTQGVDCFSARNLAKQLSCSVQPLYSEFDNMEELEDALFERLFFYFRNKICLLRRVDEDSKNLDPLITMGLNYLDFAKNEFKLYQAIYFRKFAKRHLMKEHLKDVFDRLVLPTSKYKKLSEKETNKLFSGMWLFLAGLAYLLSNEIIYLTQAQQIDFLERVIQAILQDNFSLDLSILFG